ncbi:MAG: ribonuclease III [Tissierellia bacterium]|nr:ribonuclease III [Tissierellia bacterium]
MEEDISLFRKIIKDDKPDFIKEISPLKLAYIGDSVYELIVRSYCLNERTALKDLHRKKVDLVNAKAQAEIYKKIEPLLTEEEVKVAKRGRNAKGNSIPKNQSVGNYRLATGLEALIGFLFLSKKEARLFDLIEKGLDYESEKNV